MSPDTWGALLMVLMAATLVAGLAAWAPSGRWIWAPVALLLLAAAAVVAAAPDQVDVDGGVPTTLLVALGGLAAVAGGGPLTALVFDLVDRREPRADLGRAGTVLRGGTWIGALERAAIVSTLLAGWPEGLAVVLAVKGLGRYPELRAAEDGVRTGAAERFIIGTFTSVLWACGCAGVVALAS